MAPGKLLSSHLTGQLDLVLMEEELYCKCLFCTHLLSCLLSTGLLHYKLFYAVSTLLIDTLTVSTYFKLVNTPLSNSTHMTIPLQMIVPPLLSFISPLSWRLLSVQFTLMLFTFLLFTLSIFTFFSSIFTSVEIIRGI